MGRSEDLAAHSAIGSRVIVTGQIGCGKTTLSTALAARLGLVHLRLDQFNGRDDAHALAADAVASIEGGWVVDGCVWQVPESVWESADVALYLDYANSVHYRRIIGRAIRRCLAARRVAAAREIIGEERGHLEIMRRYADGNRRSWSEAGGITQTSVSILHCRHPREARALLSRIAR